MDIFDIFGEEEVVAKLTPREKELWEHVSGPADRLVESRPEAERHDKKDIDTVLMLAVYYVTKEHGLEWLHEDGSFDIYNVKDGNITRSKLRQKMKEPEISQLKDVWLLFRALWDIARECEYK